MWAVFTLPPLSIAQEIDVDFDVRAIEDTDFHGIRRLLQQVCVLVCYLGVNALSYNAAAVVSLCCSHF